MHRSPMKTNITITATVKTITSTVFEAEKLMNNGGGAENQKSRP